MNSRNGTNPDATPASPPGQDTPLDPATVAARKNKNDANLNFLTYQHMDKLFDTRAVRAGNDPWALRASSRALPADFAFQSGGKRTTLPQFMIDARMNALLVLKDGEVVTEIYRHGSDACTRFTAMSMSKSLLSALYGIAIQDGAIAGVDQPLVAHLPELQGTAYAATTLEHLMRMRSGVAWDEERDGLGQQRPRSLDEQAIHYEDFAFQATAVAEPGSRFNYSTLDSCLLGWALSRATGRSLAEYASERLWQPAGMERDGYWVMQGPPGRQREFSGAGLNATLRDFGRFGQLMLEQGRANGAQIVPEAWVIESTARGVPPARYMYQWWGGEAATDFSAEGHGGQTINVDPVQRTVVVMLSYYAGTEPLGLHATFLRALKAALK